MCNIAAYVGTRRAAPILIEMLRRIEPMNAGFFTGIATLHEGKLHYRKIEGELQYFLQHTDAADLPGNIGIIHGRTPGTGGDAWAHPFIGKRNGEPVTALVVNGALGCFAPNVPRYTALARELYDEGYEFGSKVAIPSPDGRMLSTGECVHPSDVLCQTTLRNMNRGMSEERALEKAFCEDAPSEIVGLMLSTAHPDRIFWSMLSKPMMRAVAPHGTYLASCAIAFPDDICTYPARLPHCSAGYVSADGFTATAFANPPARVAPITTTVEKKAYDHICQMLGEGAHTLAELVKAIRPLFDNADCDLAAPLTYAILYDLYKEGHLHFETRRITHTANRMDAPCYYMSFQN